MVGGVEGFLDLEGLIAAAAAAAGFAVMVAVVGEGPGAEGSGDFGDVDDELVDVYEEFFVGGGDEDVWNDVIGLVSVV